MGISRAEATGASDDRCGTWSIGDGVLYFLAILDRQDYADGALVGLSEVELHPDQTQA